MSQEIIEALQQRITAAPRMFPGAAPYRLTETAYMARQSLAYEQGPAQRGSKTPDPLAASKNKEFARLRSIIPACGTLIDDMKNGTAGISPLYYLSQTYAGKELLNYLLLENGYAANQVAELITTKHNEAPGVPNQDIGINRDPVKAWLALREPIIGRLLLKVSFSGLFQKQERILARLGAIWDATTECNEDSTPSSTLKFLRLLKTHARHVSGNTVFPQLHTGYLGEVFFRYEVLIRFMTPIKDRIRAAEILETHHPNLKLARLLATKATRTSN